MNPLSLLAYLAFFYSKAIPRILLPQALKLPKQTLIYEESFRFTQATQKKWQKLYGTSSYGIPFTYFWGCCVKSFLKTIGRLNLNYRNILHLKHEERFFNPQNNFLKPGKEYRVRNELEDIIALDEDRIAFISKTLVSEQEGEPIVELKDYIYVKRISVPDMQKLKASGLFNKRSAPPMSDFSKRAPMLTKFRSHPLPVGESMGWEYGVLSGDMNPVHISQKTVRLFGYPKAFLQGLATANYVLSILAGKEEERLAKFSISFCQPLYLGQTVNLRLDDSDFEVLDLKGNLLAYGNRERL